MEDTEMIWIAWIACGLGEWVYRERCKVCPCRLTRLIGRNFALKLFAAC